MANIVNDDDPKKVLKKKLPSQYGKYSGIVDDKGNTVRNPTYIQAVKNMVSYLKNNTPDSNVYRAEHAHTSQVYDKKKINNLV